MEESLRGGYDDDDDRKKVLEEGRKKRTTTRLQERQGVSEKGKHNKRKNDRELRTSGNAQAQPNETAFKRKEKGEKFQEAKYETRGEKAREVEALYDEGE